MLLDDAALRQLHQDLCQRNWAKLASAWPWRLLPRLRLLRSTVKRGFNGCRPEFRCLVWYHSLRPRAHPWRSPPPCVQWSAFLQLLEPGSAASATLLAMSFTNFAGGSESFTAANVIAAHRILIRAISCSSVSTATSEWTSPAVCMFCGARVFVWRICKVARMLQGSILSEARIVSAFSVVLVASMRCHLRAHQPHVPTYRARTSARVRSTRPSLPMQRASQLTPRLPSDVHARRHHEPAPAAWDPAWPTSLPRVPP